jgi:hypothetical protein
MSGFAGNGTTINGYGVPVPGFTTVNLNAGVTHGHVTIEAFARNIGDSHGIVYVPVIASALTSYQTATVIAPTTIGGQVTVAF